MKVIGHEDVTAEFDGVDIDGLVQDAKETLAVGIVLEDVLAIIAAAGDVVYSAFVLDAQGAGHGKSMAEGEPHVNDKDLTLLAFTG